MTRLPVLRISVEAPVTSFRYPHFLVGRQPSYSMPPPSTIYGHIGSALGELPDPGSFQFGYDFRFSGHSSDLEHQHIITAGGQAFTLEGQKHGTSDLGELPDPGSFQFGYDFRFSGHSSDLEHQHIITAGGQAFTLEGQKHGTSVQATVQPHVRDFLFKPKMVLYLNRPDWVSAFQSPVFCVILGRSQDLASVDRKSTRLNSSHLGISYAVFCL